VETDQYQMTQDLIVNIYQQLGLYNLDINGFLTAIRKAETLCPILDPTLWIKGQESLEGVKRMAEALRPAVQLAKGLREGKLDG